MANQLHIIVDPKRGEMSLTINNEQLTIGKFLTDVNGLQVRTLDIESQKKITLFIAKNVLQ